MRGVGRSVIGSALALALALPAVPAGAVTPAAPPAATPAATPAAAPAPVVTPAACADDGPARTVLVLHPENTPRDAVAAELSAACADLLAYHPEIGVAVARSADPDVVERLGVDRAYSGEAVSAGRSASSDALAAASDPVAPRELAAQQWDMRAIGVPEAHAIDRGRPEVVVGVADSGVADDHPALRGVFDRARSVGCVGGVERRGADAWRASGSDHGTHVAGTIAGDDPAAGFTGVAPGARIASVRVLDDDSLVYPEAVVCAVMWAAREGIAVMNHSHWTDPGLFFCRERTGDAVALEAVERAVRHAAGVGTVVVASSGNGGIDVTQRRDDPESGLPVGPGCAMIPAGVDGVLAVGATGFADRKARYSSWGTGYVAVAAPGGDRRQEPPSGQGPACVLSAVADGGYRPMCGTSMAAPHAAGVAALLAGRIPRTEVAATLQRQARALECPDEECTSSGPTTSYYGAGLVDALAAVRTPER